ncbi:hypothetical protein [Streptosporangium sp. NBC_01756]|uniref:hypothetical protein n=1 Tax=Streptosporangium sp. NBC_01756 TaxID=2975950 RepID=UPI002DD7B13A|nr:hypothetical protein [Streptosporangium sp. NBC_01756]WSC86375.1 hypothetical protein OIE48_39490 [Streptosporangium sp. NBC_01756]
MSAPAPGGRARPTAPPPHRPAGAGRAGRGGHTGQDELRKDNAAIEGEKTNPVRRCYRVWTGSCR